MALHRERALAGDFHSWAAWLRRTALAVSWVGGVGASGMTACGSRRADLRYQAGLTAADAGKPAEARAAWKDALELAPHRAGLRTNLAAFEPDAEVAKRLLDDELAKNPTLAEAKFDRALVDARAGDWDKAEKQFAVLQGADPEAAELVALCRLAKGEGVPEGATSGGAELGRWVRARDAWSHGDPAKAAAALAGTGDPLLADLRAAFLLRAGDPGSAIEAAHSQALKDLASLRAGRAPSGATPVGASTEAAKAESPELAVVALRVQAAIASQAGNWSDALGALERAWALAPSPGLRVERALALAWLGRLPEARAEIAEGLRALEQGGAPELVTRANAIQQALAAAP